MRAGTGLHARQREQVMPRRESDFDWAMKNSITPTPAPTPIHLLLSQARGPEASPFDAFPCRLAARRLTCLSDCAISAGYGPFSPQIHTRLLPATIPTPIRVTRAEIAATPVWLVAPGKAEQTRPMASRSFVQWHAPPGRHEPRPLHGVWVDAGRDGSWGEWWVEREGRRRVHALPCSRGCS